MTSTIQFENAGKTDGLEVWRIENLEMVPVPPSQYGQFYTGDSYIVLRTRSGKSILILINDSSVCIYESFF